MLELNRLIQRIRCDIAHVKKQVGSKPENKQRSSTCVVETQGCHGGRSRSPLGVWESQEQPQASFSLGMGMEKTPSISGLPMVPIR